MSATKRQAGVARRRTPEHLAVALQEQPLVGVTRGAQILGIAPSNFRRDAAPHLLEVKIEGSASAYFRSQVEELAATLAARKAERGAAANTASAGNGHQPGPDVENVVSSAKAKRGVAPIPKRGG